jgi:hypothetical protein
MSLTIYVIHYNMIQYVNVNVVVKTCPLSQALRLAELLSLKDRGRWLLNGHDQRGPHIWPSFAGKYTMENMGNLE